MSYDYITQIMERLAIVNKNRLGKQAEIPLVSASGAWSSLIFTWHELDMNKTKKSLENLIKAKLEHLEVLLNESD